MDATWGLARAARRPALRREMCSLASAAVLYPFGISSAASTGLLRLLRPDRPAPAATVTTPVVLVHGYGGNRSNWFPLQARLVDAGFVHLSAMLYNPLVSSVPQIAGQLVRQCERAMAEAGSDRVHVVGHSLGGVVLRCAVARGALGRHLDLAMTIASPHGGAPVARLGRGPVAAALRPGSALLRQVAAAPCPAGVRWVCYWSDADYVVSPSSAQLPPQLGAVSVPVPDEGHMSILRSPVLLDDAVARLRAERPAHPPFCTGTGSAPAAVALAA